MLYEVITSLAGRDTSRRRHPLLPQQYCQPCDRWFGRGCSGRLPRPHGVRIPGGSATSNSIRTNSISANGQQGIDLGNGGIELNDSCDLDAGPNNLQNYPVLVNVFSDAGSTTIEGFLNRITSYNVCYTKLLRGSEHSGVHIISVPPDSTATRRSEDDNWNPV